MQKVASILCVLLMTISFTDKALARERSLGAVFSYAGSGLDYVQFADSHHFYRYQLRVETPDLFWSEDGKAGISASASWNTVFSSIESRNGNRIRFYAGPGLGIGYSRDLKSMPGVFIGLKGCIGGECSFPRGIALSISISPMLGGHFSKKDGMIRMGLHKWGLCYGLMPEAGIRYIF